MISHRDGHQVLVCDGCHELIETENPTFHLWTLQSSGEQIHVHTSRCVSKYRPPTDQRPAQRKLAIKRLLHALIELKRREAEVQD